MRLIGNILWFVCVGLWTGIVWWMLGLLWCLSIVGIPVGIQCFKFGSLSFLPFGKEVVFSSDTGRLILNIIWIIFGGIELAMGYLAAGLILCLTIVGIPFGLQCFKLMKLSLLPLGAKVIEKS